jgi:protein-L-isoaspartate(D-aspartate) O-methyltransferase
MPTLLDDESTYGPAAQRMVDHDLIRRGIGDPRVIHAMRCIPRHSFLAPHLLSRAYDDCALPTRNGQTISQPYIVAAMSEMLRVAPDHCVLEIGTGSGYQTMILARLARRVVSIERDPQLSQQARQSLDRFGINNVELHVGDGSLGWPAGSDVPTYDRILVTAGAPAPPPALLAQLKDGGRMVIPVGDDRYQVMTCVDKSAGRTVAIPGIECRFVPLIGEQAWPEQPT